jgi:DNA modification methylase
MKIESKVLKQGPVLWHDLEFIQEPDFKELSKKDYEKLKQSILQQGFIDPLKVWHDKKSGTLYCLDGKHRQLVLQQLEKDGVEISGKLPAIFINCRDRNHAAQLVLVYSSIYAKITEESLYKFFDVERLKFDDMKLQISIPEIGMERFERGWMTDKPVEDEAPDAPKEARTKPGDIYELGKHRVMCGDSTKAEDVRLLMHEARARLFATDPPYGVDYAKTKDGIPRSGYATQVEDWGNMVGDELKDVKLQAFLEACFRSYVPFLDHAAWYLWHAYLTQGFFAAAAAADVILHRQIIWKKSGFNLTRSGMYHWNHEPCFYGWQRGKQPAWYGDKSQTSVWEIARNPEKGIHPTQKPAEIFLIPIRNHLRAGEICADPFLGSGTQVIAAEQTKRICYGMEIEPKYVDVTVQRWVNFTGIESIKLNGEPIIWKKDK